MSKAVVAAVGGIVGFLLVTSTAYAANVVAEDTASIVDVAKPVLEAVMVGNYWYAAALALVLVVAILKRYGGDIPKVGPFLQTEEGAITLLFAGSFGGALATAIAAGASPGVGLLWPAVMVAVTAAGGYRILKIMLVPRLEKLRDKSPTWLKLPLNLLLWVFQRDEKAVKKAGDEAVKKNPPTGVSGVIGVPKDVP